MELINDYYNQFYKVTKKDQINLIKNKLTELYYMKISCILEEDNFFKDDNSFDYYEALEDCKKIKYRYSKFFMALYEKNKDNYKASEDDLFKQSIKDYQEVLINIITQKEKNLKFFEINNVYVILNVIRTYNNNLQEEINFTVEEFKDLNKEEYIKKELLNDLISYYKKDKALKLLEGIKSFLETIETIEKTEYFEDIKNSFKKLGLEEISKEEINETTNMLLQKGFDININEETPTIKFFKSIKKDAILFLKTFMDSKTDIRNLNELVVESDLSELQTSDIDNLYYVFEFFAAIFNNKEIKNDKLLMEILGKQLNNNKETWAKIDSYQKIYGEIKRVYQLYAKNPVKTIAKVNLILNDSIVNIFKDNENDDISFNITYMKKVEDKVKKDQKKMEGNVCIEELEELRDELLLSFDNSQRSKFESQGNEGDKGKARKKYINLMDNIKQLISTLNSLLLSGYPYISDFKLYIKGSI